MILAPGRNCWRVEKAGRFRCVQDGAEFFRLVRDAILKAERSIFIVGWDIAAGVDLLPGDPGGKEPTTLAALLDFVVRRRRRLSAHVLIWDYSAVYALERDPFSRWKLGFGTHRRVHFRFDPVHPLGASHHQKIVVVDDRLAFSGGLDLTGHRWDTPEHAAENPLRTNLAGKTYEPFHDVQAMVEGPAAARLGELARDRWRRRAAGRLPPVDSSGGSLWPADVEADLADVDVAIARTDPGLHRSAPIRECEALFLDSIAAARRTIYIENQYFTNRRMAEALAARLREEDGPEVVVVGPKECSGWLEERTMGALRHAVYALLLEADVHHRLRLTMAVASRSKEVCTFIHSKVMVVDDELLRIGSANLSNRSMGMDTECDLVAVAEGDEKKRRGIARVRARLLSEHVGISASEVERVIEAQGSLRAAVDAFEAADRGLVPIASASAPVEVPEAVRAAADPEEPMQVTRTLGRLLPEIEAEERRRGRFLLPVAFLFAAAFVAWHASEGHRAVSLAALRDLIADASWSPALAAGALLVFALSGVLFVPPELLVLATVVLLGPLHGGALALAGALAAAAAGYAIGRALGLRRLVPWIGQRAYRLWRELKGSGASSVALLRLVSVSSATTVHLLSGAARVAPREYWLGTLIGIAPGFVALCLLGGLLRRMILHPGPKTAAFAAFTAIGLAALVLRSRRVFLLKKLGPSMREQIERARYG